MNKKLLGLLLVVIIIISFFAGCGSAKTSDSAANYAMDKGAQKSSYYGQNEAVAPDGTVAGAVGGDTAYTTSEKQKADGKADSIAGTGTASQNVSNAILSERKVIRSANVTIEVKNFDEAYGRIDTIILGIGFIQSTNINSEKYFVKDEQKLLRSGTIVIRVDSDKFDKVLNSLKGIGEVQNWNINGEDVTDKYFDTESRLRLLRIEEGKLEEYLKKLNDLDAIFKTESRLTEIRYEIESLTGNLKKMSDLVELSTITINISETRPGVDPVKPKTYGQELLDNFLDSMKGVAGFIGDLIIILVAAVPVIVLLGLFLLLAIFIYRKIPKKDTSGRSNVKSVQMAEKQEDSRDQK